MRTGRRKVIVSCAVTGAVHTPSMSEFLPLTPEQIAQQAVDAARAGAAVLHLDARDPVDGSPTHDAETCARLASAVRSRTDAVIAVSTGGVVAAPADQRFAGPLPDAADIVSIDMGAVAHSYRTAARGMSEWKYGWEKAFVEGSDGLLHGNTLRGIKTLLARFGHADGMRFVFECHDPSHLYNLAHCMEEGLADAPFFVQFHLGMTGGLGSDHENVYLMQGTADRLFGRGNYEFSVAVHGRNQIAMAALAAITGGHVRVGLADSLYLGKGLLAASCAAQVLKIRRILEDLSLEIASADEAREMLRMNGSPRPGHVAREARLNG